MAEQPKTAAATQPTGAQKDVLVKAREVGKDLPAAEKVTNDTPIPAGDVTGFRVASEAAEEGSDISPRKGDIGGLSAATKVRNTTLAERDKKEMERRGGAPGSFSASVSFEGMMMIENGLSDPFPVSGSYTGPVSKDGLKVRPLTPEEEKRFTAGGAPANRRVSDSEPRASDLTRGSGAGGGGNPMHAGDSRGVADAGRTGVVGSGVTSKGNPASPQGGGTDTRKG